MLAFVLAQLPAPVDQQIDDEGARVITGGDPPEVIVRLADADVTVAEYAVPSPGAPVEPIAIGTVQWTAISAEAAMRVVKALVAAAREARRATFVVCAMCDRATPPEAMASDDLCEECADFDSGVVH